MGDLNFRLLEDLEMSLEEIVARVKKGEFQKLFDYDQLRYVMRKGDAFTELQEGDVTFPPTFKFEVESSFYDCKRVFLYYSFGGYKFISRTFLYIIYYANMNYIGGIF